jgi:hypothetical protein
VVGRAEGAVVAGTFAEDAGGVTGLTPEGKDICVGAVGAERGLDAAVGGGVEVKGGVGVAGEAAGRGEGAGLAGIGAILADVAD